MPGTFNANTGVVGVSECTKCPDSQYSLLEGQTSGAACTPCKDIPVGKVCKNAPKDNVTYPPNEFCKCSGEDAPVALTLGHFTTDGVSEAPCNAGYYNDGSFNHCEECPAGTWSDKSAAACKKCPANTFSIVKKAHIEAMCQACGENEVSEEGAVECKPKPEPTPAPEAAAEAEQVAEVAVTAN